MPAFVQPPLMPTLDSAPADFTPFHVNDKRLRYALDTSDEAIVISDASLKIVYLNSGFTQLFGFSAQEALGQELNQLLLGSHSDPLLLDNINSDIRAYGRHHSKVLLYTKTGMPLWISMTVNTDQDAHDPQSDRITVMSDISSTEMHVLLQKRVLEGMVKELPLKQLMALVCHEVQKIVPEITASILAVDAQGLIHPLAAPGLPAHISAALDGLSIGPQCGSCGTAAYRREPVEVLDITSDPLWSNYHPLFQSTGLRSCWSSPIFDPQGNVVGTFAFYSKEARHPAPIHRQLVEVCLHLCALALERDNTRQRIHQLAFYDNLTGLPNRSMFHASAKRALAKLHTHEQSGALLFVDLDRFKQINDVQGHAAGDALLKGVAQRLSKCLQANDLIGRLAGDEFVLFLPERTTEQAVDMAHHMLETLALPMEVLGQINVPGASIGIAMFPDHGNSIDVLLRHADQAMAQAKRSAQHSLQLFSADLNRRILERAALERALRHALSEGQLTLHYQPQVLSSAPNILHGVEALARWNHPEWGAVSPQQFIPVAEEAGLIHELTLWLLNEACQQLAAWRKAGLIVPCIGVNLSGRSFRHTEFAQQINEALQRHHLQPSDLLLEITESVMLDAQPITLSNIEALHSMGFKLSLDDFGTGYSSLSYLHRLPISELKLDKAFVQDLPDSATARALTVSVLSIAHSLNMLVVAEGVETQGQQQWLQAHGCPVLQGYLFSKPLPAQELQAWYHAQAPRLGPGLR